MITVCLNEANFEYDIHSLVQAFFAGEEVKVFAGQEKITRLEQERTPLLHMEIAYLPDKAATEAAGNQEGAMQSVNAGTDEAATEAAGNQEGTGRNPAAASVDGEVRQAAGQGEKDRIEISIYLPPEHKNSPIPSGQPFAAGGYILRAQTSAGTDFSNRKMTKDRLKQALYQMLVEYTGHTLPWGSLTGIRPVKIPMSMLGQGKGEQEIRDYMAQAYFASEQKINLSIEIAKRERELLRQISYKDGYSLYVGIPFCPSICSYCSFSSSPISLWEGKVGQYLDALEQEIDFTAASFGHKKLNTVYIGGGTPTTLTPVQLDRLLSKIKRSFDFSDLLEYTVEAGRPDSITREKLEVLREYGISRISINPQTMKQETLDLIGRRHTVEQAKESYYLARELGFCNINMDLIVGLPGETLADVRDTMEQIKALAPDNLTVHSLAIKRAAKLKTCAGEYRGMQMANSWETIELTAKYAKELGLFPYYLYRQKNMAGNFENVGYAKPGKAGLYNILMMEEVQTIVACGAGSVSKRVYPDGRIERSENVKDVSQYIERIGEMIERKKHLLCDC